MTINQSYQILNTLTTQILGETAVLQADLSNLVDIGKALQNMQAGDILRRGLMDQIGRMVFEARILHDHGPNIIVDGAEYGSIEMHYDLATLPEAVENKAVDLVDGRAYPQDVYHGYEVVSQMYNKLGTFDIPYSIDDKYLWPAFKSANQMSGFLDMIKRYVESSMNMKIQAVKQAALNNLIAETMYDEYSGSATPGTTTTEKAVNLWKVCKDLFGNDWAKTWKTAQKDKDAGLVAVNTIGKYLMRFMNPGVLLNMAGAYRECSYEDIHLVMQADFLADFNTFTMSDVWHNEFAKLPNGIETVASWQGILDGSAGGFSPEATQAVNVVTSANHQVAIKGLVAVMFDKRACAMTIHSQRVTAEPYNADGEFQTYHEKCDYRALNNFRENCVIFFWDDTVS